MLIHDDIFSWEGFGGVYRLAAGSCRLRIFDLTKDRRHKVMHIKPIVVVVSDMPDDGPKIKNVSVRSCASHIATSVVAQFGIDPHRLVYVEYYCSSTYGERGQHVIPAKFDAVEFVWHGDKALHPRWQPLGPPLLDIMAELIDQC